MDGWEVAMLVPWMFADIVMEVWYVEGCDSGGEAWV